LTYDAWRLETSTPIFGQCNDEILAQLFYQFQKLFTVPTYFNSRFSFTTMGSIEHCDERPNFKAAHQPESRIGLPVEPVSPSSLSAPILQADWGVSHMGRRTIGRTQQRARCPRAEHTALKLEALVGTLGAVLVVSDKNPEMACERGDGQAYSYGSPDQPPRAHRLHSIGRRHMGYQSRPRRPAQRRRQGLMGQGQA
jgi:hypothetical protein